jgi:DNA modification methylase
MKRLPDGCVSAVITDPPYGVNYQSAWRTDRSAWKPKITNDSQPFIWWIGEAFRLVKDGGCLLCFCHWKTAEAFRLAIGWAGFSIVSQVIWDRMSHGMGDLKGSFAPQHDLIWFASKGRFEFPGKRPKSVIACNRIGGDKLEHPTEKPLELTKQLVEAVTRPNEVVLDPMCGSGSTLIAAEGLGRKWIGFDCSQEYCDLAEQRLQWYRNTGGKQVIFR